MPNDNSNKPQEDTVLKNQFEPGRKRRPYTPPRIVSAEPLEAAAAACDEGGTGGFGKTFPAPPCTVGGS